jgi:ribonuclease HII
VDRRRRAAGAGLQEEQRLWAQGLRFVAGVDEAGVGPLAGPVVAAAVVLPPTPEALPIGVRDSKQLAPAVRERLEAEVRAVALAVAVAVVEPEEIDRVNIYHAALGAMRLAVQRLSLVPQHVLVDGRAIPDLVLPQTRFVGGDRTVYSIAAASILAKVYRDRLMLGLDARYPHYGFARHKGYGTARHREALRRFGPSPVHRRSFNLLGRRPG